MAFGTGVADRLREIARVRLRQSHGVYTVRPQGPSRDGSLPLIVDGMIDPNNGATELVLGMMPKDMRGVNAGLIVDLSAPSEFDALNFDPKNKLHRSNKSPLLQIGVPPITSAIRHFGPSVCQFDGDRHIQIVLGSMGDLGGEFRDLGKFDAEKIAAFELGEFSHGTETRILPSIEYMLEVLCSQQGVQMAWIGILTTGDFDDYDALAAWAESYIIQMSQGRAPETKIVLMAMRGSHEKKLADLDNFRVPGIDLDLFDCQIAHDIAHAAELLFIEPLRTKTLPVADRAVVFANGALVREYANGVPQVMTFQVAPGVRQLELSIDGGIYTTIKLY